MASVEKARIGNSLDMGHLHPARSAYPDNLKLTLLNQRAGGALPSALCSASCPASVGRTCTSRKLAGSNHFAAADLTCSAVIALKPASAIAGEDSIARRGWVCASASKSSQ